MPCGPCKISRRGIFFEYSPGNSPRLRIPMARHHIFLVPGFFGFSNLGGITYFHHVREVLEEHFARRGLEVQILSVSTYPTASIRSRAARLAEAMAKYAGDDEGPIYLIGHSTGGLDTRLVVTPHVSLPTDVEVESLARRVKAVVTLATPHMGTPMASLFNSVFGQNLLFAMTLGMIYSLRFGRLPLRAVAELIGLVVHFDRRLGLEDTIREQFYEELFRDFDAERREAIHEFLNHIRRDRNLVGQLTPGAIDLFNASTTDREGVRYGSVITRAARPSLRGMAELRLNPYAHGQHIFFRLLQGVTGQNSHYFDLRSGQEQLFLRAYGDIPTGRSNDGVVPTLSQIWGEIIHVTWADHLDICGHFRDPGHKPPHVDWFVSGSDFRRPQFEALWADVVSYILSEDWGWP